MKAILTYHSIDDSGSVISIAPDVFRHQIGWLAQHGPRVVGVQDLPGVEGPAIAITFDDAFVNFGETAWPILRDHGMPATLYVPTDHVGGKNAWSSDEAGIPQLPLLGWSALDRLVSQGVTIGSHTCTHPRLTLVGDGAVREELERSALQLENMLGVQPAGLAYPYGAWDARVAAAAAEVYEHACTTELRAVRPGEDRYRLPRVDAYYLRSHHTIEGWGTWGLRLYLGARAGARRCRELLESMSGR